MPTAWDKHDIIVMGEVVIKEPYTTPIGKDERAVSRVRLVLEQERKRLGLDK